MAYPKMGEITDKFVGQPYDLNSVLSPAKVWEKLDAQSEEVRVFTNSLIDLLNSTGEDNWLYTAIVNAILGQITDGSLTDVKLSDEAGQIKDRLTTHSINVSNPHLVTTTQIGAIPSTHETWEKIAEQTLSSAVAQVDFENIPSGYKNFKLMLEGRADVDTTAGIKLIFNDDTGGNYRAASISLTYVNLNFALPKSSYAFSFYNVQISNFNASQQKVIFTDGIYQDGSAVNDRNSSNYTWVNTVDEISKMSLIATSNLIGIGSRFVLWGCK